MSEDFYETLGVETDASQADIESAYRERVKETHPDVSDEEGTAEEFKRVVRAEEVLGDADERERYDRLGHAAYVSDVDGFGADVEEEEDDDPFGDRWKAEWTEPSEDSGPSHHARQRARRRAEWFTDDGAGGGDGGVGADSMGEQGGPTGGARSGSGAAGGAANAAGAGPTAGSGRTDGSGGFDVGGFGGGTGSEGDSTYSVHDWSDEELEEESVRVNLTQELVVLVTGMFVLYPMFVYSTLTPMFPLVVNLFVGLCTLVVVGYLLTMPRVGMAVFGAWSGIATLAMLVTGWSPLSVTGLVAVIATFVPFCYSVAVARLLRQP